MNYIAQLLQDGLIYENNGLYIKYYDDIKFDKYRSGANILGEIYLNNVEPINVNNNFLIVNTQVGDFTFKINPLNKKNKTFGYIYVGESNFVKIVMDSKKTNKSKKKNKGLFIIPILIISLLVGGVYIYSYIQKSKPENPSILEPNPIVEQSTLNVSDAETEIPLYVSFNITTSETINLSNPKSNVVSFKYEIYKDDTKLFTTNNIEPGKSEIIKLGDYLSHGEYDLKFKIRCFYNGNEVNGTEEIVNVIIN